MAAVELHKSGVYRRIVRRLYAAREVWRKPRIMRKLQKWRRRESKLRMIENLRAYADFSCRRRSRSHMRVNALTDNPFALAIS